MKNSTRPIARLDQVRLISIEDAFLREREILDRIKSGSDTFVCFFWEANHKCLVAPRSMRSVLESGCSRSEEAGWPVYFRHTGGDITPQGPGIVNFSVAYSSPVHKASSISQTYRDLCNPIISALGNIGILGWTGSVENSFCDGLFNVVVNNRKFAGTAQRIGKTRWNRNRNAILAHALMMIDHASSEGIHAINRLYEESGLEQRVNAKMNTSLADCHVDGSIFLRSLVEDANSYFGQLSNAEFVTV